MHDQNEHSGTKPFTRRSVVRTAAWTVPAVSLTAAAPAFAVSPATGQPIGSPNQLRVALGDDRSELLRIQTGLTNSNPLAISTLPTGPNQFTVTNGSAGTVSGASATITITFDEALIAFGSSPGIEVLAATRVGGSSSAIDRAAPSPKDKAIPVPLFGSVTYLKSYTTAATISLPSLPTGPTTFDLSYALTGLPTAPTLPLGLDLSALIAVLGVSVNPSVGVIPQYDVALTLNHSGITGAAPTAAARIVSVVNLSTSLLV